MPIDVLEDILSSRKRQVGLDKKKVSIADLERRIKAGAIPPDFMSAVHRTGRISLIAEMKRSSPSAGLIREPYRVDEIARAYQQAGVAALSVLTEPEKFGGRIDDIDRARTAAPLPILRKDFVFDPYQVIEARAHGASAVLLIADMLEKTQVKELTACAQEAGLVALVEVFTAESVSSAVESGSRLVGINTRNLRTLEMAPGNVAKLSKLFPSGFVIVAESGVKTPSDVASFKGLGIAAVLVGESLLKQKELEPAARVLVEAGL